MHQMDPYINWQTDQTRPHIKLGSHITLGYKSNKPMQQIKSTHQIRSIDHIGLMYQLGHIPN